MGIAFQVNREAAPITGVQEETDATPLADANQRVRYKTLDAWRGLAALAVVLLHGAVPLLDGRFKALLAQPVWAATLYGALGVQLFFVVSGYCIAGAAIKELSFGSARHYLLARLRRIWPPYLAGLALAGAMIFLHGSLVRQGLIVPVEKYLDPSQLDLRWGLAHLTLTQTPLRVRPLNGVFWTLCYEIAFYGIVGFLILPWWKLNERRLLWVLHTLTLLSLALLVIRPEWRVYPLDQWPLFGLGVFVYDLTRHPKNKGVKLAALLGAGMLIAFVGMHRWGGEGLMLTSQVQFSAGLCFAVLLWLLRPFDHKIAALPFVRWLARLGVFSYSIYLAHIPLRGTLLGFLTARGLSQENFWLVPACFVPLSLVAGWLFHLAFERPWMKGRLPTWMYQRPSSPE